MTPVEPFDLLGPLPAGTTVLEASAGTGKTFTIAGLVTRLVAEGVTPLEQLLVVTFGRAATQELRERVRERLVSARDVLADPVAARARPDDPLARHLATGTDAEVAARRHRLVEAAARYDAATVVTTHGFCEQVLRSLGTAGDVDDDVVLVEDLDDLTVEVVDDFYVRKWGVPGAPPPAISLEQALALARVAVGDPMAALVPAHTDDPTAATRVAFATGVRAEVERRKRARRVIGFDDLLTRLRSTLRDPVTGPPARARLRGRFATVLVDEFQDTDPVQWEILRTAFHGHARLVLVGDPKQAIYAFRGADVFAYLDAVGAAGHHATLDHNWRSDPAVLSGLSALFRGAALGDPRIAVTEVAAGRDGCSLAVPGAPVQLRVLPSGGEKTVAPLREAVVRDLVAEIVDLLGSGAELSPRDGGAPRPLEPGDLAVVVRTGTQLDLAHDALLRAGVPAVRRTTSSVFRTPAACDWKVLLEALEQPHRSARVRRLALSAFVGWDAARLDREGVDALSVRLRWWIAVHAERGVAALFEAVSREFDLAGRLLGQTGGERFITDLRHVGETLHSATVTDQLGLTAGLEWLRHRIDDAAGDSAVERSRRLDSDAAAVQCVTIHSSKGLEFPVVYVPFGWDRYLPDTADLPLFHDDDGHRARDVGGFSHRGFAESVLRHRAEELGEDLRLLYVALTRAQARVTAWWAPAKVNTPHAPLHRLLFCADPAAGVPERVDLPGDSAARTHLEAFAVDGVLDVVRVPERGPAHLHRPAVAGVPLARGELRRELDTAWRRTSYTSLTAAVHDSRPVIGSEPDVTETDDEPDTPAPSGGDDTELRTVPSPWADLPGGAAFGTTVHSVFEALDTRAADLAVEVGARVGAALATDGVGGIDPCTLAAAVTFAVTTPLGPLADGVALAAIAPGDRLAELEFELPLGGGERPAGASSSLRDLAAVWRRHLTPADPLAPYADLLDEPVLAASALRGYLTGSIDAVLRVGDRYVVVDYKTNRLGTPEIPLTAYDYRPAAMADAMLQAHYPLQALLYEVALHRFLRWRVAGYDPAVHLGGVLYLFLRGMCGPGVTFSDGAVPGVFTWHPPAGLVVAASDVLAGGAR